MSLLNKLTIKNLRLNKKRTIVTIIGILLSVALITAVASMYVSCVDSLIRFEIYRDGNFHVSYYDVPVEDLEVFQNHREIEDVYLTYDIGYAKIDTENEYKPYAFVKALTKDSLENLSIRLVEGRLPENDHEILIPTHLKTNGRLDIPVGSEITLDVGTRINLDDGVELKQNNPFLENEDIIDTSSQRYRVVGLIERPASNIEGYSAPGYTFITLANEEQLPQMVDVYARYTKDGLKNAYKLTANIVGADEELFEKYYDGVATFAESEEYRQQEENEKYLFQINSYLIDLETDPLGINQTSGLAVVVVIVIVIILFTSVFCIKNSFDISITEKTKQYGMLRSIGTTKKQIRRNVFYEATILGCIGIPLGIFSGLIAAYLLILISNYFLSESLAIGLNLKFSFSILSIVIAIVLGMVTIYLSALRSALRASRVSPIDSIRNSANIQIKPNKIKSPKWIKKIFGMGGEISYKNLKRNKKKYRTTVISIVVSVAVFVALFSFMSIAFDSVDNELKISEYNLMLYSNDVDSQDKLNRYIETTQFDHIDNYTILRQRGFEISNREFNPEYVEFMHLQQELSSTQYLYIYSLGEEQYQKYIHELGLNYDEISHKAILMDYMKVGQVVNSKTIYRTLRLTDYQKGDLLSGSLDDSHDLQIEVGYITDQKPFGLKNNQGIYLVVSDEFFNQIPDSTHSSLLDIFYQSSDADQLQDDLDEFLKDEDYQLNNIEENVRMMNNLFTLIGIFLYGFICVISLIGITNIFNTITTNMELRRQEFAMLKSIGMTTKEFRTMIHLETFFMGIKSLFFGLVIGISLSYLIYYLLGRDAGIVYRFPIVAVLLAILVVFGLISLIMKYSMNKINKQNTIETIRNENI